MTNSLRDALRQSGALDQFKPVGGGRDAGKANGKGKGKRPEQRRPAAAPRPAPARSEEEIDLAKAYALRARTEQREREARLKAEREAAERRRLQRERLQALIEGKTLNRDDAEHPRHFEYGGKIRRVYVDDGQLEQVNDGRLGVVQIRGRYLLVERAVAEAARTIDASAVALLVEPEPSVA